MTYAASIVYLRDGSGYTTGVAAHCTCGWTGPPREWPSQTLADLVAHDHQTPGDDT